MITFVIARFNENIDFVHEEMFVGNKIVIYNKGNEIEEGELPDNVFVKKLENVGKCDHTYLYHIIDQYQDLDDITCFMPASWRTCGLKSFRLKKTIRCLNETGKTSMVVYDADTDRLASLYDFTLDSYKTGNLENFSLNQSNEMLISSIRPFGRWYEYYIGKSVPIRSDAMQGIFGVQKIHIWQRGIDFYKQLYNQVSTHNNPEVGHYLERSWSSIFQPLPTNCFYHIDRNTFQNLSPVE